jgi:hypothetical protein
LALHSLTETAAKHSPARPAARAFLAPILEAHLRTFADRLTAAITERLRELETGEPGPEVEAAPLLLSPGLAADFLGVSSTRFWEWSKTPGFPAKVGAPGKRASHYRRTDLEVWVAGLSCAAHSGAVSRKENS